MCDETCVMILPATIAGTCVMILSAASAVACLVGSDVWGPYDTIAVAYLICGAVEEQLHST